MLKGMPAMSRAEAAFCRSAPWRFAARRAVLPWVLMGEQLQGEVLELGSGSGAMAAEMLRRFPELRFTATDLDPEMVDRASDELASFGPRATVREADATQLPFDSGRFDGVVSFVMLHHVVEWEKAIAEAMRVLRPGGILLVADFQDFGLLRTLERASGNEVRPIRLDELRPVLTSLELEEADLRPAARTLFRLKARRAG
jgi:ubiquinone/menaquinone biosynthesis C-methylase UbiE